LALLLLLSCGGRTEPFEKGGAVPIEKVASEWRKALCDRIYACCSAAERKGNDVIGKDAQSCRAAVEAETSYFLGDVQTSVAEGRLAYNPDKMAKCLADLKARSCDAVKMPPGNMDVTQMCEGVFEPKVAPGGACTEYWDCIGGWCAGDIGGLMDRCIPRGAEGTVCDEGPECLSGICDEHNTCVKRPAGSGNLCNLGTESEGQH
jgi:hypothetical protein